jgi:DNA-binding response OmpR family regulator
MDQKFIENILSSLSILYIEDDIKYSENVSNALLLKTNSLFTAMTVKEAVNIYNEEDIDIIITEMTLNNGNTIGFMKNIRSINKNIPIIIISNVKEIEYLLEAIKLNLTNYILKPIDLKILRESLCKSVVNIYDNGLYEVEFKNGVKYNFRKKTLFLDDEILPLTSKEVRLLDILLYNRQSLLPKENLKDLIWENEYDISDEALKSLLNRIRKKIGKETIENVSSSGYLLKLKDD